MRGRMKNVDGTPLFQEIRMLRSKRDSGYAIRTGWMVGPLSLFVLIAAHGPVANGQTLSQPTMADSVVSRLVAWRGRTDQPVWLATLTAFDWDSFSVTKGPAGDAMANCGRAGLLPCGPELQPPAGQPVQVLRFRRGSTQVYEERIMAERTACSPSRCRPACPVPQRHSCPARTGRGGSSGACRTARSCASRHRFSTAADAERRPAAASVSMSA